MFDLERSERAIIIFLVLTLLLGAGVIVYQKSRSSADVRIGTFEPLRAASSVTDKAKVNINEAGSRELMKLKGVGKVLAGRIVEYRASRGLFISVEDIKKVRGIGQALFDKIKDDISIE